MDQILESHQHYSPNKSGRHWPQRLLAGFGPTAVSVHQCSKPETLLGEEKKKKKRQLQREMSVLIDFVSSVSHRH